MEEKLKKLKELLAEVADLNHAASLLGWDQQTYMPPGSAGSRGNQLATLERLSHIRFTSDEVGTLLEELQPYVDQLPPDSDEARLVKVTRRRYTKNAKVPAKFVAEFSKATTDAYQVWVQARKENNFTKFQPYLKQVVELRRQYASFFAPYDHIYDPLLDDFEPGLKTADVKAIFNILRPQQVELLKQIAERPQVDNSFLSQEYEDQKQWDFGVEVITRFGYDWEHGRQDKTAHPFTTSFGVDDVRITTRIVHNDLASGLFSTLHECGHGLYNLGVNPAYDRTPLAHGASLALHESQSRLWENLVGRSLPFWTYYYPRLQEIFPSQLGNVDLTRFYKGINQVKPTLIRINADEATYNLHIMLRLELEIAMIEGAIDTADLPETWHARMQEYLGVVPPDDADGVMQDVHWSEGLIGYFSTYSLGNLVSAQLWEQIHKEIPDLDDQIQKGEFSALLNWLKTNIHQYGAKYEPQELVQKVTGSTIDPEPYMRYLCMKYGEIYGF
ncbi:MAG: carboxypeptidase M32 [Omnitrophica WOR_2 bacterium]